MLLAFLHLHHLQLQHFEPAQTPAQALKAEITPGSTGQIKATRPPVPRAAAGKPRAPLPPLHGSRWLHRCSARSIPLPGRPFAASTLHFIFVAQFPPMTVHFCKMSQGLITGKQEGTTTAYLLSVYKLSHRRRAARQQQTGTEVLRLATGHTSHLSFL